MFVVIPKRSSWSMTALFAGTVLSMSISGCGGAPLAQVATEIPQAEVSKGAVEEYRLTKENLAVEADVRASAAYTVEFPVATGTLRLSPESPSASSLEVDIDVTNANSGIQLVADIARDHFLHAAEHPKARFVSRSLQKAPGGEPDEYILYGDLTLHGKTISLSMPAKLELDSCKAGLDVEFGVDRQAFGVVATGMLESVVSNKVVVRIKANVKRASCADHTALSRGAPAPTEAD